MSEAELIYTALVELSTRQIAESVEATGLEENKSASKKGGGSPSRQGENSKARQEKASSSDRIFFLLRRNR